MLVDFAEEEVRDRPEQTTWRDALARFDRQELIGFDLSRIVHSERFDRRKAEKRPTISLPPNFDEILANAGPPTEDNDNYFEFTTKPVMTRY